MGGGHYLTSLDMEIVMAILNQKSKAGRFPRWIGLTIALHGDKNKHIEQWAAIENPEESPHTATVT